MTQINDVLYWKMDEVRYMIAKGWVTTGVAGGTYKLTAAGLTKAADTLKALNFEDKFLLTQKTNANADIDPLTL